MQALLRESVHRSEDPELVPPRMLNSTRCSASRVPPRAGYFDALGTMLHPSDDAEHLAFDFDGRNRRPPRDPINALLSFGYATLTRGLAVTLTAVGFDPHLASIISPGTAARYGRPALALTEEFRR